MYPNKDEYNGQWKNDKRSGEGAFTYASIGLTDISIWEDDKEIKIIERDIKL